jgi:excisionase family DNA binding protein
MIIPDPYKERYITVQTVAERLGCLEQHVYALIQDGKLTAVRIGERALRIAESSFDRFISANIINPANYFAPADPEPEKQDPLPAVTARSAWMSRR